MYAWRIGQANDPLDRALLAALALFAIACVFSQYPRQSFDSATGALAFVSATYVVRRELAHGRSRVVFVGALMAASVVITLTTLARWAPVVAEWLFLTGWTTPPPLNLPLNAQPWGHRHDVVLLAVVLAPSWWVGRPGPMRRLIGAVVVTLVALLVVIDGSRNTWLAVGVASVLLVALRRHHRIRVVQAAGAHWRIAAGLAAIGSVVLVASGVLSTIAERAMALTPLASRGAMWVELTSLWQANSIAGLGPGSFPWLLQLTEHFDVSTWAPRHPDSLLFHVLPEAGILGIGAVLSAAIALMVAVARASSRPASWALVVVMVAGIGANPANFAFLLVPSIVWLGMAAPRTDEPSPERRPVLRIPVLSTVAVLFAAQVATLAALAQYEEARASVANGETGRAISSLRSATSLDPTMGLYWRQLGTAYLTSGELEQSWTAAKRAVHINPSDDLAWRILAVVELRRNALDSAAEAAARAVDLQAADVTNLLLATEVAIQRGDSEGARDFLADVVQGWPHIVFSDGWTRMVARGGLLPSEVVQGAVIQADGGEPSPTGPQPLLGVLADRSDIVAGALSGSGLPNELRSALQASYQCDATGPLLGHASGAAQRSPVYWALIIRDQSRAGASSEREHRVYRLMTGIDLRSEPPTLNALHENAGLGSIDRWGYRREPIYWSSDASLDLPSPAFAAARWIADPNSISRTPAIRMFMPRCAS